LERDCKNDESSKELIEVFPKKYHAINHNMTLNSSYVILHTNLR